MARRQIGIAGLLALLSVCPTRAAPAPLFADEFAGHALDSGKWQAINWNAPTVAGRFGGRFAYRPGGIAVGDGVLRLTYDADAHQSGRVQSRTAFLYGDFRIRTRLPIGQGLWPALWLRTPGPVIQDEVDLIEGYGPDAGSAQSTIHYWRDGAALGQACTILSIGTASPQGRIDPACARRSVPLAGDLSAFHVYELRWTADAVTWLIDGHAYQTITGRVPHRPMAIVLNLSVESPWSRGAPASGRSDPLVVDWVRVDPVPGARTLGP